MAVCFGDSKFAIKQTGAELKSKVGRVDWFYLPGSAVFFFLKKKPNKRRFPAKDILK